MSHAIHSRMVSGVLVASAGIWLAAQQPTFRSATELVLVDVSVVDGQGRPLTGLGAADFAVKVDGKPRRIVSAEFVSIGTAASNTAGDTRPRFSSNESGGRPAPGRTLLLAVDEESIDFGTISAPLAALRRFVGGLAPADRVGLTVLPRASVSVEFTTNHALVVEALGRVSGRRSGATTHYNIGLAEAFAFAAQDAITWTRVVNRECETDPSPEVCTSSLEADARRLADDAERQSTQTLASLLALINALGRLDGPKTLVLLSGGLPVSEYVQFSGPFNQDVLTVARAAAQSRVTLYALRIGRYQSGIDVTRVSLNTSGDAAIASAGLDVLAGASRGTLFDVVGTGDTYLRRLALETSAYYLLGLEPAEGDRDGRPHKIEVQVTRADITVRARREFVAVEPHARATRPEDEVVRLLASGQPASEIPIKVATYVTRDPGADRIRLVIVGEVDQQKSAAADVALGYLIRDATGRTLGRIVEQARLRPADPAAPSALRHDSSVFLQPGKYSLLLAVVDRQGRRGIVEHPVDARLARAGGLVASDIMVAEPTPGPGAEWRPSVTGEAGETLPAIVEIHANDRARAGALSATFEIATEETGPAIVSEPASVQTVGNRTTARGAIPLGLLPPGEYIARAVIFSAGREVLRVSRSVARVRRPAGVARDAEASRQATIAALTDGLVPARFDRNQLLDRLMVERFLTRTRNEGQEAPAAATVAAMDAARDGRFDAALRAARGARADDLSAAFVRGLALLAANSLELAAAEFRACLRIDPEFYPAIVYLGACYAAGGHHRDAAGAWQTALITESDLPLLYRLIGDAWVRAGSGPQALGILSEAVERWPGDGALRLRLAVVRAMAGDEREALKALDPYLTDHGDDHRAWLLAAGLLFAARLEGRAVDDPVRDGERAARYAERYVAAGGDRQALVARWLQYLKPDGTDAARRP